MSPPGNTQVGTPIFPATGPSQAKMAFQDFGALRSFPARAAAVTRTVRSRACVVGGAARVFEGEGRRRGALLFFAMTTRLDD